MSEFITDVEASEYRGESFNYRRDNIFNNPNSDVSIRNELVNALATNVQSIIQNNPQRDFGAEPIRILDVGAYDGDTMIRLVDHLTESGVDADLDLVLVEPVASLEIPDWFRDANGSDGVNVHVIPSEFDNSTLDDIKDEYGIDSFDIINYGFVIYHLQSERFILNASNDLLRPETSTGYIVVTNVGDQYMAPIVNIEANRGFSSQSNSLMSEIIVDDENETFYASSVRVYKSTVEFGTDIIKEYQSKHSMFNRIHEQNKDTDTSYFNSNWESENPSGIGMLDFRIDTYRRNHKKD